MIMRSSQRICYTHTHTQLHNCFERTDSMFIHSRITFWSLLLVFLFVNWYMWRWILYLCIWGFGFRNSGLCTKIIEESRLQFIEYSYGFWLKNLHYGKGFSLRKSGIMKSRVLFIVPDLRNTTQKQCSDAVKSIVWPVTF